MNDSDLEALSSIPPALALVGIGVANAPARVVVEGGIPYAVVPDGYKLTNVEHLLPRPIAKRGSFTLADAASFCAFVNRHKTASTTIYVEPRLGEFVAVLDEHGVDATPGQREFRAALKLRHSVEWKRWVENNGRQMGQAEFASFIEDNLPDVFDPPGTAMLEVSRTLEAKKSANFASSVRLSDGSSQFMYEEQIDGTAAKGTMKIPDTFTLAIPVFDGGARYKVPVRLRYRIRDRGALSMWFDMDRPHKIVEDAVEQTTKAIRDSIADVLVLNGQA